jgi:hypothetical protein
MREHAIERRAGKQDERWRERSTDAQRIAPSGVKAGDSAAIAS